MLKKCLLIIVLGFIVYSNSLNNTAFISGYDSITDNPLIQNCRNIPVIFTKAILHYKDQYHPLSLAVEAVLRTVISGKNIIGWRISLIMLHVIAALLLYTLIFIVFRKDKVSLLGAVVFLVHPVSTAAVNVVGNICLLLDVILLLSTMIMVLLALKENRAGYYALSVMMFIGGLFNSNLILVVLPVVLILFLAALVFKKSNIKPIRAFTLLLAVLIAYLLYHFITLNIKLYPITFFPENKFILGQFIYTAREAFKTVISGVVTFIYPYQDNSVHCTEKCLYILVVFYSIALSYMFYLVCDRIEKVKCLAFMIIFLVGLYYLPCTFMENRRYATDVTFWNSQDGEEEKYRLARSYYKAGLFDEAMKHFMVIADEGSPERKKYSFSFLSEIHSREGDYRTAFYYLIKLAKLIKKHEFLEDIELHSYNTGITPIKKKKVEDRMLFFKSAGKLYFYIGLYDWSEYFFSRLYLYNPYDIENLHYLAGIMNCKKYYSASRVYLERILQLMPCYTPALEEIKYVDGIIAGKVKTDAGHYRQGKLNVPKDERELMVKYLFYGEMSCNEKIRKKARSFYMSVYNRVKSKYIEICKEEQDTPYYRDKLDILNELEKEYKEIAGFLKENNKEFDEVMLSPDVALSYLNISKGWYGLHNINKAFEVCVKAIKIDPDYASAHNNLGVYYCELGNYNQGYSRFAEALELDPKHQDAADNMNKLLEIMQH